MKRTIAAILFFGVVLVSSSGAHAEQISVDSRITAVTVFPDSALLTRAVKAQVPAGTHQIILAGIIPEIDQDSLRVAARDAAQVKLLGARLDTRFLEEPPSPRVKELTGEIEKLEDEAAGLSGLAQVLADEKEYLDSIRLFSKTQLPEDLATRTPLAKDLEENLKFLGVKLRENSAALLQNGIQQRELSEKIDALLMELDRISGSPQKISRSIIVDVQASAGAAVELDVSYMVHGAYWEPLYEARADFEKSEVELVLYGVVRQKTGEDWPEVTLSLSTAKPAVGGSMPYVDPWFLRVIQPVREALSGGRMPRAQKAEMVMQNAAFNDAVSEMESAVVAEPQTRILDTGIAVSYELPQKASCKSDGEDNKFLVTSQKLKANFEYSAYPRAVLLAYLGSRVANAPELQLLAGSVNIFLSGDFVGASSIEKIGPGEEFDLYLGADENVKVERKLLEKKRDETIIAGIPSPTVTTVFKYKLRIENYKGKQIALKLFEAMPVSQDDRIKVKIGKVSLEPAVKDWKDRKGIWLWELSLAPKQKQEIFYSYSIEHPRDMRVEGL